MDTIAAPMPVDISMSEPIFAVGMNGSGTTMLLDCLGFHSQIYAFPYETRLIPYTAKYIHKFGNLDNDDNFLRLWKTVGRFSAFRRANNYVLPPIPENWRQLPRSLSAVIDSYFRYFAQKEGKVRWCEKTPQHVQHLELLSELFPNAKFLHIIRDGRDCAVSLHRRYKRIPELTMYRWKKIVPMGRDAGKRLGHRYLEVKYEDLTTDPDLWMREIGSFLEIPFEEAVLQSHQRQRGKKKQLGKIEFNSEKWCSYFSRNRIKRMEYIAGQVLSTLGYVVATEPFDHDPSSIAIWYWQMKDYIVNYSIILWKKVIRKRKKTWRMVITAPVRAIKQSISNKY